MPESSLLACHDFRCDGLHNRISVNCVGMIESGSGADGKKQAEGSADDVSGDVITHSELLGNLAGAFDFHTASLGGCGLPRFGLPGERLPVSQEVIHLG